MRTSYDPKADAYYARFAPDDTEIAETEEVVGVEVLSVAARGSGAYGGRSVLSAAQ